MTEIGFGEFFIGAIADEMMTFSGHRHSPIWGESAPSLEPFDQRRSFDLLDLSDTDGWDELYDCIADGVYHNLGPWNRCVSILRQLGALTCVIEFHYVCLDLRGEVAAFNAQLDTPVERAAIRLHFFSETVKFDSISTLSPGEKASYLGYVVCRRPGSPVVGRCVLRTPAYVDVSASVDEQVNFFGQTLEVRGVPFMQQDERYAVCAHVAAWIVLYIAHRRAIIERKLISDVVSASAAHRSMHPAAPPALTAEAVQGAVQSLGLHFPIRQVVNDDGRLSCSRVTAQDLGLTQDDLDELARMCADLVESYGDIDPDSAPVAPEVEDDARLFLSELLTNLRLADVDTEHLLRQSGWLDPEASVKRAIKTIDAAVFDELRHYIDSGFAIYCQTLDHAMVLAGYSRESKGSYTFYLHDDQFGPYLRSDSLVSASKSEFRRQSYSDGPSDLQFEAPKIDRAAPEHVSGDQARGEPNRSITTFGVASPPRLLLSPDAALKNARAQISSASNDWDSLTPSTDSDDVASIIVTDNLRASIVMGIDYKRDRLKNCSAGDVDARLLFSTVHLAEWVVVVEMLSEDGESAIAEMVYDGTSADEHPLLQLCCFDGTVLYRNPIGWPDIDLGSVSGFKPACLVVPSRVGKG